MLLDLFSTLFKEHVLSKPRQGVFLALILKLDFRPIYINFGFFLINIKTQASSH